MRKIEKIEFIMDLFRRKIKGRKPETLWYKYGHTGRRGHWLELMFGININGLSKPDMFGYELKIESEYITSFGDWSPNYYIYNQPQYKHIFDKDDQIANRNIFLYMFARKNQTIPGRYSWTGESAPKIDRWNTFGQKLFVAKNKDISIIYDFQQDQRPNKELKVPNEFRNGEIVLAKWYGRRLPIYKNSVYHGRSLKDRVEGKFGVEGFCIAKTNKHGYFNSMKFGPAITYEHFVSQVEKGIVFFSCGMNNQNHRSYCHWQARNDQFWDKLATEEYF
ncbi:LlaMI family restriction endonuclease [Mycoplasma simbae]|uniref:LlaMI family restriction endonuclease n=1 Tax=Mycoplasma simbae TaxID=36744 RepID=UPI000496003E|nr:LlaMI family restriction endonuclease [Mycoplasma simbae]